jgi:hypothetical protein
MHRPRLFALNAFAMHACRKRSSHQVTPRERGESVSEGRRAALPIRCPAVGSRFACTALPEPQCLYAIWIMIGGELCLSFGALLPMEITSVVDVM